MIILISVLVLAAVLVVTLHVEHIQKQKITLEQQKKALAPPGIMLSKINTDYYQGKVIGHVSCPRIGLDCDLVYGTTDGDLWKAPVSTTTAVSPALPPHRSLPATPACISRVLPMRRKATG